MKKRRETVRREHNPMWLLRHCGRVDVRPWLRDLKEVPLRRRLDLLAHTKLPNTSSVAPLADACFRRSA